MDCSVCSVLCNGLSASLHETSQKVGASRKQTLADLRSMARLSAATGSDVYGIIYRLDFSLEWADAKFDRTFVLKPTGTSQTRS